jgi:hypothetical protein
LFIAHILLTGAARSFQEQSVSSSTSITFLILQIVVAFLMVWHVGKYSYVFSKNKKHSILQSLLGFIWFGLIGIFISYYAVQRDYHIVVGKVVSKTNKALRLFLIIIGATVALGVLASIVLSALNAKNLTNKTGVESNSSQSAWVNVISPDGKLSANLPKDWEFNPDNSKVSGNIPTYSWVASDQNGNVAYIIKSENYQSTFKELNFSENMSLADKQKILKALSDNQVKEFVIKDFSSQFIDIQGHTAIKYTGSVIKSGENWNIEGNMILVDKSTYSVIAFYKAGYANEIDRIIKTLVIK